MSHGQQIARNAAWLLVATTAQKVIAFLTFTFIARWVGAEVTGQYFFAVSVTSVFVILTDLGMTPVVIREMAQNEESGRAAFARALRLKLTLIPVAVAASLLYGWLAHTSPQVFLAIGVATFVMSADALSLIWYGAMRGKRQLRYEALGMFVGQILTAIVSVTAAVWMLGPAGLAFGLFAGSAWNVLWSMVQATKLGVGPAKSGGWSTNRLVTAAIPFALAGIFVKVYSYVDTLLLRQFHGETAVGHYAVAYKVTYAFQFLPLAFVAALYPGMSAAYASKEKKDLEKILTGSLRLMLLVSTPLAAALSAFADRLVPFVYGPQFSGSIVPLMILPWVLIPIFLDFPIGSLLNATHRAGLKTTAMGITCAVNVIANAILVPIYGPVGAAWSGAISFWILFLCGLWFARHDVPGQGWFVWLFARGMFVAFGVWLAIRFLAVEMSLPIAILFAAALSLTLLFATKLLLIEDVKMLLRWSKKKAQPVDPIDEKLHSQR